MHIPAHTVYHVKMNENIKLKEIFICFLKIDDQFYKRILCNIKYSNPKKCFHQKLHKEKLETHLGYLKVAKSVDTTLKAANDTPCGTPIHKKLFRFN